MDHDHRFPADFLKDVFRRRRLRQKAFGRTAGLRTGSGIPDDIGMHDLFDDAAESPADPEDPEAGITSDPELPFRVMKYDVSKGEMPSVSGHRSLFQRETVECEVYHGPGRDLFGPGGIRVRKGAFELVFYANHECASLFSEEDGTVYLYYCHPEVVCMDIRRPELKFSCLAVVGESSHWLFADIDVPGTRLSDIRAYSELTPAQKEYVNKRARRKELPADNTADIRDDFKPFLEEEQIEMLYHVCKDSLPRKTRQKAETLMGGLRGFSTDSDTLTQLSYYLGIDTHPVKREKISYDQVIAIMDKYIYGREDLKAMIAECVMEAQYASSSYFSILLVGSPGVGKTNFGEALSEVFGNEVIFIDCGITQPIDLFGVVKSYKDAQPSRIAQEFRALGHTDAVVIMDEIDKMVTEDHDGNGFSALIKPLGPQRVYHDDFLNDDIDVSNCKFVCTANDYHRIPEHIIDRFEGRVVFLSDYSDHEKAEIGKMFIFPRELREHHIDPSRLSVTDEALLLIAKEYCSDKGAREMTGNIRAIFRKVITEWERGILSWPTVVDEDYVRSHLTKKTRNSFGFNRPVPA